MHCALCQQPKELCKSHIIPDFLYKTIYDQKHRFKAIHSDPVKVTSHQSGAYESLLCKDCEGKLSKYESYVADVLTKEYTKFINLKIKDMLYFDIDYKKARLFYLSLLWRMSISTHAFFKNFSIPKYNETLRKLILNEDPGNPKEFGCSATIPLINNSFKREWILDPHSAKLRNDDVCCVVIGGVCYIFFLTFKNNPKNVSQAFIRTDNKWLIAKYDAREMPLINDAFKTVQKILKNNP